MAFNKEDLSDEELYGKPPFWDSAESYQIFDEYDRLLERYNKLKERLEEVKKLLNKEL